MSEEETQERPDGKINITITEETVSYDSNLQLPDIVFWIEVVKAMVVNRNLSGSE